MASYQYTLISGNSAFDRWYYGKERNAISKQAKRGFELFTGKGQCITCHLIQEDYALFTDEKLHNTGLGYQATMHKEPAKKKVTLGAGIVVEVGAGVEHVKEGDRVASNGHHGDIVKVPKHLVARIPETVSDEEAAFTVLGSIALHGIRLSRPSLGEQYAVFGMGLVGLITTQLLIANGCKVLAIDINQKRLEIAKNTVRKS